MDIVHNCKSYLEDQLNTINKFLQQNVETRIEMNLRENRNDLDTIFEQQIFVKNVMEKDEHVRGLRRQIREDTKTIDEIRKDCAKIATDSIKKRQEILAEQSKELEKYQLILMKKIAEDQQRHKQILQQREQELAGLISEYEREEKGRAGLLANLEKSLQRNIEERQKNLENGQRNLSDTLGLNGTGLREPNRIELMSVDEYAPYGTEPTASVTSKRGRGSGVKKSTGAAGSTRGRSARGRRAART